VAFLQVVTRCYRRPAMLAANIEALEAQSDPDWAQTMIIDGVGLGVGAAQAELATFAPTLRGQYIWILDDDDVCTRARLVQEVKAIAAEHDPDIIMVRMDHGRRGILPDNAHWQRPPAHSWIGVSAVIVRRQLWQRHAGAFATARYDSDFDFISALFGADPEIYWHDVIAAKVQRISMGRAE